MSDEKPPTAPRELWQARTDAGARAVIERIDSIREEVKELKSDLTVQVEEVRGSLQATLDHYVSHKYLLVIAGTFALAVASASWFLTKAATARVEKDRVDDRAEFRTGIAEIKTSVEKAETKMEKRTKALYEHAKTKRKQGVLEQPVEEHDE